MVQATELKIYILIINELGYQIKGKNMTKEKGRETEKDTEKEHYFLPFSWKYYIM